jgi:hypothetical protein
LVEHQLPKLRVASSNLVARSMKSRGYRRWLVASFSLVSVRVSIVFNKNQQNQLTKILFKAIFSGLALFQEQGQDVNSKEGENVMDDVYGVAGIKDRGGRRAGTDRRTFCISGYGFERRSRQDRRSGLERRIVKEDFLNLFKPKRGTDEYIEFLRGLKGFFHGIYFGSLLWGMIIISIVFIRARWD